MTIHPLLAIIDAARESERLGSASTEELAVARPEMAE